jgi:hypothetical protein
MHKKNGQSVQCSISHSQRPDPRQTASASQPTATPDVKMHAMKLSNNNNQSL